MSATIQTDINSNGVAVVTLNRPQKHNAFDDAIITELQQTFDDIDQNPNVKVMVLAAQGKSFSAGADLSWMKRMADYSYQENFDDAQALATMLRTLDQMSKPTIAKVQGAAYGGAVGLVSCCDMAVGTPAARFCLSEVKLGLVPATISPYVVRAIGLRAARRYCLTAEVIDANSALDLGLLSAVVEDDQLDTKVSELCDAVLANGQQAMAATKKLVAQVATQDLTADLVEHTSGVIAKARVSNEAQQRLAEFLNSRDSNKGSEGNKEKSGDDNV